jgi:Leucine-rich repeat (LRR) protein
MMNNIKPEMFEHLKGLEELYLDRNVITILRTKLFSKLSQLKALVLSHNMINEIDFSCFENLDKLHRLELSGVRKKLVLTPFKNFLPNLRELELENGPIELVKQFDFTFLEKLNFKSSELDQFVLDRISSGKTRSLNLRNARFLDIQDKVDFHVNQFSSNLIEIDLSGVPLSLGFQGKLLIKTFDLKQMSLFNCGYFRNLSIRLYTNLTSIDLSDNQIDSLPDWYLYSTSELLKLNLSRNSLKILKYNTFWFQRNLTILDFR